MPVQEHAAEEAAQYPTNYIIAVVNDRQEAQRAVSALSDAGFSHVDVLAGVDALRMIEQKMDEQNPLAKLWENLRKTLTDEGANEHAYLDELRRGHSVVMAQVANAEDATRAGDILRGYHAHIVQHFDQWTVTNLPDAPPSPA